MIRMNRHLAAQIDDWAKETFQYPDCSDEGHAPGSYALSKRGGIAPELRQFFYDHVPSRGWLLTPVGLSILDPFAKFLVLRARQYLEKVEARHQRMKQGAEARREQSAARRRAEPLPEECMHALTAMQERLKQQLAPKPIDPKREWRLCDGGALRQRINQRQQESSSWRALAESLAGRTTRELPGATTEQLLALEALSLRFPNFEDVVRLIRDRVALSVFTGEPLSLPRLLLVGPPGIGKTAFLSELSVCLSVHWTLLSMAEMSAGWLLSGASGTWRDAQPGAILRLVDECPDKALPMLVLDELDKANQGHHATDRALLGVLEPRTAARFRDEYLNAEIDVRPKAFMATANALPRSSPLTSRFQVVKVAAPRQDQTPMVVRSVERALRRDRPELNACFSELSEDIVQALARLTPRQVRIVLEGAYSRAALRHIDSSKAVGGDQGKVPLIQDDFGEAIRVPSTVKKTPQLMPIYVGLEFVGWRVQ